MDYLIPMWAGIAFNLLMIAANYAVPWHTPFGCWYFDRNGGLKIMIGAWLCFVGWFLILVIQR